MNCEVTDNQRAGAAVGHHSVLVIIRKYALTCIGLLDSANGRRRRWPCHSLGIERGGHLGTHSRACLQVQIE